MKTFSVVTYDEDCASVIWGTFDQHSLIDALPYFMKMNNASDFYVVDSERSRQVHLDDLYYFFKKDGRYDD